MRCCVRDGGRSSGIALQGEVSNHRRLRRLSAVRGERCGKGATGSRQVWVRKASVSEPLTTCRKKLQWRRNRGETRVPGRVWGEPADCPDGVRHVGGASLAWALARNVRTCRPDTVPSAGWGREGVPQAAHTVRGRVPSRGTGADRLVVVMKPGNAGGAKGTGHPGLLGGQPAGPGGAG